MGIRHSKMPFLWQKMASRWHKRVNNTNVPLYGKQKDCIAYSVGSCISDYQPIIGQISSGILIGLYLLAKEVTVFEAQVVAGFMLTCSNYISSSQFLLVRLVSILHDHHPGHMNHYQLHPLFVKQFLLSTQINLQRLIHP